MIEIVPRKAFYSLASLLKQWSYGLAVSIMGWEQILGLQPRPTESEHVLEQDSQGGFYAH